MELVFATTNPHKVREARAILEPYGLAVRSLGDQGCELAEPVEDGATFEDNALLKARYYAHHLGLPCLADDSGLEVDALGGAPGVHSARFAGVDADRATCDAANNRKLLEALEGTPAERRGARFVSVVCLADPQGRLVAMARGTFEGRIAFEAAGARGFGYDPLFFLPELGCTSAELSSEEKNRRSHRGHALRELARELDALGYAALGNR